MKYKTLLSESIEAHAKKKEKILRESKEKFIVKDTILFEDEDGNKEELPVKKAIARLAYLFSIRIMSAKQEKMPKLNSALMLLTQAQVISDDDKQMAKKLYNQARKLLRN